MSLMNINTRERVLFTSSRLTRSWPTPSPLVGEGVGQLRVGREEVKSAPPSQPSPIKREGAKTSSPAGAGGLRQLRVGREGAKTQMA